MNELTKKIFMKLPKEYRDVKFEVYKCDSSFNEDCKYELSLQSSWVDEMDSQVIYCKNMKDVIFCIRCTNRWRVRFVPMNRPYVKKDEWVVEREFRNSFGGWGGAILKHFDTKQDALDFLKQRFGWEAKDIIVKE